MINLGTDVDRTWSFENGDIILAKDYGNISQAVVNRLNTDLDFYDIFYTKYGGNLWEHMGDLNIPTIHEYIRIEIESILQQDPRIRNIECMVEKTSSSSVRCDLSILLYDNTTTTTINLIITPEYGVSILQENTEELI